MSTQRHAGRPAQDMCEDVLSLIFAMTLERSHAPAPAPSLQPMDVALQLACLATVCANWRKVALSLPALWAHALDVTMPFEAFARALSRTYSPGPDRIPQPLFIYVDELQDQYEIQDDSLAHLLREFNRFRRLTVVLNNTPSSLTPSLIRSLQGSAPLLETISIHTGALRRSSALQHFHAIALNLPFLGGEASNLRHLYMTNFLIIPSPTDPAFSNLVTVKLSNECDSMALEWVQSWLERLSNGDLAMLKILSIDGLSAKGLSFVSLGSYTLPPSLQQFTISGAVLACAKILRSTVIPLTCNVHVSMSQPADRDFVLSPSSVEECAQALNHLWRQDPECEQYNLSYESLINRAREALHLTQKSSTRRVELRFLCFTLHWCPDLVPEFVRLLEEAPRALNTQGCIALDLSIRNDSTLIDILRNVLGVFSKIQVLRVLQYDHPFVLKFRDIVGIFCNGKPGMRMLFPGVRHVEVNASLMRDQSFANTVHEFGGIRPPSITIFEPSKEGAGGHVERLYQA